MIRVTEFKKYKPGYYLLLPTFNSQSLFLYRVRRLVADHIEVLETNSTGLSYSQYIKLDNDFNLFKSYWIQPISKNQYTFLKNWWAPEIHN